MPGHPFVVRHQFVNCLVNAVMNKMITGGGFVSGGGIRIDNHDQTQPGRKQQMSLDVFGVAWFEGGGDRSFIEIIAETRGDIQHVARRRVQFANFVRQKINDAFSQCQRTNRVRIPAPRAARAVEAQSAVLDQALQKLAREKRISTAERGDDFR